MRTAEQNLQLLRELEDNRRFLLLAYASNPDLLARAEPRIRALFEPLPEPPADAVAANTNTARTLPAAPGEKP